MGIGVTVLVALSGCVDQQKEVQLYRSVYEKGLPKPEPLEDGQTLTLQRALLLANSDNEQIASQGENYLQALIAKHRAFSAFLPTVSAQPNFTVEQAPRGNAATAAPGAPPESAAAVAASQGGYVQDGGVLRRLEVPIVGDFEFSPKAIPLYKAADLVVVQQRQLLLDGRATILLNVAQTYYQVLIAAQQVAVLKHSLALQQARVRDLQVRLKMLLAMRLDVSQAQSNEAATRVQLSAAENDERNARRTLALLIGSARVDGPLIDTTIADDPPEPVKSYVDRAIANRQDVQAAHAAVEAAHYAVKAAIAEYYPSVSLNVSGFLYRQDFANATKWDGILLANIPIFSAGTIKADVRNAWSHLRQAALFESYLRRSVDQGVRTAYDNLATSGAKLADLRREVETATLAYAEAVEQEKNGLAIPLDVLTAQDMLLNSQLQYADEAFTRTIDRLDLIRATGDLDPLTPEHLHWTPAPSPNQFSGQYH